jgi:predicted enzyme related to lactoylglutathione lyase
MPAAVTVTETFFSISASDPARAIRFYVDVLGATVSFSTPVWTSLYIARVRIGVFTDPAHKGARTGLHFAVADLAQTCAAIERAGGKRSSPAIEVAPRVRIAEMIDTEGNVFVLREDS